jgi:serine/threonine-protein kinase/endoribonuclease IRE1
MITAWDLMDPRDAVHQILSGLTYLHGINIVHRDIKPQVRLSVLDINPKNILIADFINPSKKLRFVISDFGLGKRLEDEQSFFSVTHASATGTHGWRAPECINASITLKTGELKASERLKITKSIDIFSVGCVIYYIMTNGSHPFGDKLKREHNIMKGNVQIEKLDKLKNGVLARDLIKRMISYDPLRRYVG